MLTAERNLISIGKAARAAGVDVDRYADAATSIGVKAAETIDGVPLLNRGDAERVRQHLAEREVK
jgi:hypothetical protein